MRWWLIKARKDRGLTQAELCKIAKVAQPLYSHYESGRVCPRYETAKRIADVLGINWTYFFEEPSVLTIDSTAR